MLAAKLVTPTKDEQKLVEESLKAINWKVSTEAEKLKLDVLLFEGGSIAKGTWLPGISDMDFFLRFDYAKYKNKDISKLAEKLLKRCFDIDKLHGSRDYFKTNHFGFDIEFVPVLRISKHTQALNITDVSPLHVKWLRKRERTNRKLSKEIRLAKQFFKAAGVYGAESYIRGFSGHVIEILTAHYGSFEKLIKTIAKWGSEQIIDTEKYYKSKKQILAGINPDKRVGPLVVVDPVQPERNAAAVVSLDNFEKIKKYCTKFLRSPSIDKFARKWRTVEELLARVKNRKLILMRAKPIEDKIDIAGAKILKKFEQVKELLSEADFNILKADWQWDKRKDALLWIYLDSKRLSQVKRHWGPPVEMESHCVAFKKEWKGVKVSSGKLYVDLERKWRSVEEIVSYLKKDTALKSFRFS